MSQIGFYYWRGKPWHLFVDKATGRQFVSLPQWLRDEWKRDVKRGKIKLQYT